MADPRKNEDGSAFPKKRMLDLPDSINLIPDEKIEVCKDESVSDKKQKLDLPIETSKNDILSFTEDGAMTVSKESIHASAKEEDKGDGKEGNVKDADDLKVEDETFDLAGKTFAAAEKGKGILVEESETILASAKDDGCGDGKEGNKVDADDLKGDDEIFGMEGKSFNVAEKGKGILIEKSETDNEGNGYYSDDDLSDFCKGLYSDSEDGMMESKESIHTAAKEEVGEDGKEGNIVGSDDLNGEDGKEGNIVGSDDLKGEDEIFDLTGTSSTSAEKGNDILTEESQTGNNGDNYDSDDDLCNYCKGLDSDAEDDLNP